MGFLPYSVLLYLPGEIPHTWGKPNTAGVNWYEKVTATSKSFKI